MEIFEAWLPPRRRERMQKLVKKVRQAAGSARDFDVLLMRWVEHIRHEPSSHAALLVEQIKQRRHQAQEPIDSIYEKLARIRFKHRRKMLLKEMRVPESMEQCGERFSCFARVALGQLVAPYLKAAAGELEDAAVMHAFRIQSKQLRYAMEMFAGAFDEEFRKQLYPLVEMLQDRLGAINDHVTAQSYFAEMHSQAASCGVRAALEMGIDREQQDLESSRQAFFDWWSPARREDLCRRFQRYVDLGPASLSPSDSSEDAGPR